jgi:hypothetical protein
MKRLLNILGTSLLIFSFATAAVHAQDTRAAEIAQQQAEKAKQLEANLPSKGERLLNWAEAHSNDPSTFYTTFGGMYPSAGFAPGLAYRDAFGGARFNAGVGWSFKNYKLAQGSLGWPDLFGDKLEVNTRVRWTDATQVPFYGVGNESVKDDRVNYGLKALEAGGSATLKPWWWYRLGGGVAYRRYEDREGSGSHPSIETIPSIVPGLFSDSRYTQTTAFTAIDWRESPGYTRSGGLYSVTFNDYNDADDVFGFRRLDVDLRQMVPLLKEQWVLAFRGLVTMTDAADNQLVPYYLLPSLGGSRRHRGYSDFRFQDENLLLVSGEYRWMPSRIVDMALFVDAGKVTSDRSDLDFNDLKTAYGIGVRIHGPALTPVRIDVAHASEGWRIHLTGGLPF